MTRPGLALLVLTFATPVLAQPPMPPDQQAEVILTAGRKAYTEGNLPVAAQRFQEVVQKFANTPQANPARFGLALCLLNSPEQDFAKAADLLTHPANDGGFADRGPALYQLGVCHRQLGIKDQANPAAANPRFEKAAQAFNTAKDWFAGKKDADWAARSRCDLAEVQLRLNKVKEARQTTEPFEKDAALAENKHRPLGLYYHGLACFLDKDPRAAGRSLGQLAPFRDPAFGRHAQYLYGRVLHLGGETAEASVHYDRVLADHAKAKTDAAQALTQPDRFRNNPFEKARLEALAKGPPPEYVAGAAFHGACLNYEAGKFAEALAKLQTFAKDFPGSPLQPDADLRAGLCLVQLRQFDEAARLLQPLADKTPRLADQALFWLGKARLGLALAVENPADRENKVKAAASTLKQAADRANQLAGSDPDAKTRRPEMLFEYADALQTAKQFKEAADVYQQLWNENALPARREEVLQRLASAAGAAGDIARSDQRCDEFRRTFPQSVLTPAVAFRQAENRFARAAELAKNRGANPNDLKKRYEEAAGKYKEVAEKFPEFERVNFTRFGLGVCLAQLGDLDEAVKALEAIPAPDRTGELAPAAYLLADCLIRQAPAKAEDALQENQVREKLAAAAQLLDGFVAASPKAPEAPAALLKLGFCHKRLGATLADPNERNQTLNRARETFEKLSRDYPNDPLAGHGVLERAKVRALMGDVGGAMNDLRQFTQNAALQTSPAAPLGAVHLATLHRQQNQPAEAEKVLAEARRRYEPELARDPDRAEWAHLLKYHHGVAIFETGKPADARKLFDEVVTQAKGTPVAAEAALRAGQCRVAEGKMLIEDGQKARGQAGTDKTKTQQAEKLIEQGTNAIREAADQLARRGDEFKERLPTADARARMYYDAAWAWRTVADQERAKSQEKAPPGEEKAVAAYRRLIAEFPDAAISVDARFELAELAAGQGKHDEAVKLLKEALDREPSDRPVPSDTVERIRLRLGASLAAMKDYAGAVSQFEAVAGNPKSPYLAQALYRAGDALFAAGEIAKAAEKLAPFRDRGELHHAGGVSDRAVLRLGQALAGAKEWDKSRQTFEVFLQRYGNSPLAPDARYGIGWALQNRSRYDEAVASYQQVIAATTAEPAAHAQLGIGHCRLAQKRYVEAAAAFLVVPYTYEAYPELGYAAMLEAARAFVAAGQPDQAEQTLRRLLKDAPKDSEWAKAAEERLRKLKK